MKKSDLEKAMGEYQELQQQIAALEAKKAQVADQIKAYMEKAGLEEIQVGNSTARYKEITSTRFDSKAFATAHKRLYGMFCKPQTIRRFTVA